ncbi:MAG: UDP-4-amino-4-deoxy-L-arabinose--oxoglutarate aminotransferase [Actinomycetota bacterium]
MSVHRGRVAAVAPIPLIRPVFGPEEEAAVSEVLRSGWVAQGPRVAGFEEAFAERVGAVDAVAVSSCTTALQLALVLAGIGPGDDVVVPSFSFIATANAVVHVGARPVFADVDPATGNLTQDTVTEALTSRTRAVIVVHQAGVPADVDELGRLCRRLGVTLVQDAACAIGSTIGDRPIGGHGDFTAFSFHPRKVLTTGEGGMLVVPDAATGARARRLREHGMDVSAFERHRSGTDTVERYLEPGFNFRMTDVQAAIGLVQLSKLDEIVERRRRIGDGYRQRLAAVPGVRCVPEPRGSVSNHQSFWIEVDPQRGADRDGLMRALADDDISTRRGIMAAHLEPAMSAWSDRPLPVTERLTATSLILPLHHGMSSGDIDRVCTRIASTIGVPA